MRFCIVHYNTPELTTCLCASLLKHHPDAHITIFDNSDKNPFTNAKLFNAEYIDNTKQQLVNFASIINEAKLYMPAEDVKYHYLTSKSNWGSLKHASSVQWLIDNSTENFVLLDSDILIKQNLDEFCDDNYISVGEFDCNRLLPFCLFLNIKKIKALNIKFFDIKTFNACKLSTDTGGTLLSEIRRHNECIKKIELSNFIVHFGNGSWRYTNKANLKNTANGDYKSFLMTNKNLWY